MYDSAEGHWAVALGLSPGLPSFLKSLKGDSTVEAHIEQFISLLKRRQIRGSRSCAVATTHLLRRVVVDSKGPDAAKLIERVRIVGSRLSAAQPRELAVGNIVRRVLGLVREVVADDAEIDPSNMSDLAGRSQTPSSAEDEPQRPGLTSSISTFSPLRHGATEPMQSNLTQDPAFPDAPYLTKRPALVSSTTTGSTLGTSLFGLFSQAEKGSPIGTPPGYQSPNGQITSTKTVVKDEVLNGISEMLDELEVVDDQIAGYALEHIHANELILTFTPSTTVRKFLLAAAKKRKFTVFHAGAFSHDNDGTEQYVQALTGAGIQVNLIADAAIFAVMSRMNMVILGTHAILAQGGLVAAAGTRAIAQAAKLNSAHVFVLGGVYKLSPIYPFNIEELIEYGDAGEIIDYRDGDFVEDVDVENPLYDYIPPEMIDLYITNIGGHIPSHSYRIVADHYSVEDTHL